MKSTVAELHCLHEEAHIGIIWHFSLITRNIVVIGEWILRFMNKKLRIGWMVYRKNSGRFTDILTLANRIFSDAFPYTDLFIECDFTALFRKPFCKT